MVFRGVSHCLVHVYQWWCLRACCGEGGSDSWCRAAWWVGHLCHIVRDGYQREVGVQEVQLALPRDWRGTQDQEWEIKGEFNTCVLIVVCLTFWNSKAIIVPYWLPVIWSWYTGCWWVGCYIWYSEEGTGQSHSLPRPLLVVPNVKLVQSLELRSVVGQQRTCY